MRYARRDVTATERPIRLPSGVRDFLPRAAARRRALAEDVLRVFEAWGYARIITPQFERADVLERGLGAGDRATAIRFVEPGTGEVVALRPDITPQIARVVATRMAEIPGPIRLCYEGAVTRIGEHGQREVLQAGIELVDAASPHGDAEVIAVAAAALAALRLPEVALDVGHVAPVQHVLAAAPDDRCRAALSAALARKDRAGLRVAARALPTEVAPLAEALGTLWGEPTATLARARALPWPSTVQRALAELEAVLAALPALAPTAPVLTIDLGELRGFDYYTGVRFAAFAAGAPTAVLRGGRYDELLARYRGAPRPATGFAIDLEVVAQALRTLGVAAPRSPLGIAVHGAGAAALARALRAAGARVAVQADPPADWAAWLVGAGLDVAIAADRVLAPANAPVSAVAFAAARAGDASGLVAELEALRGP